MAENFVRILPAVPFGAVGVFLAARGDQSSNTTMLVVGFVLFFIGFVWIGVCSIRGMRIMLRD